MNIPWLGAAYLTSRTLGQESELTTLLVEYTQRPLPALLELAAIHPFTGWGSVQNGPVDTDPL